MKSKKYLSYALLRDEEIELLNFFAKTFSQDIEKFHHKQRLSQHDKCLLFKSIFHLLNQLRYFNTTTKSED